MGRRVLILLRSRRFREAERLWQGRKAAVDRKKKSTEESRTTVFRHTDNVLKFRARDNESFPQKLNNYEMMILKL
jgi:hypothetical protein